MRKFSFLFALSALLLLAGCDGGSMIVDWYPVEMKIYLQDAEGNDLFAPQSKGYCRADSITFLGNTYFEVADEEPWPASRAYLARLDGYRYLWGADGNILVFGEIDGARDYDDDITIYWSDGRRDVVHYRCWNHNELRGSVRREWKLNGKKCDSPITIVH